MAGMSIGALFQDLRGQPTPPRYSTPDNSVVAKTDDAHPATQCRLDAYLQGSLCTKPLDEEQVNDAPGPGTCTAAQGFSVGLRPKCWYKAPINQAAPEVALRPANLSSAKDIQIKIDDLRHALSGQGR